MKSMVRYGNVGGAVAVLLVGLTVLILLVKPELVVAQETTYSQNELSFIQAVASRYTTQADTTAAFTSYKNLVKENTYYRLACSLLSLRSLDAFSKGRKLSPSDPEITRVTQKFVDDFQIIRNPQDPMYWIAAAPGFDCIVALNLARQAIPQPTLDAALGQLLSLARELYRERTVAHYQRRQQEVNSEVNTQLEESGIDAAFFNAAALLLPNSGQGAPSATERANFSNRAKELVDYMFSQCDSTCPFRTGSWMANNHLFKPNPHYTKSGLILLAEIAALHKQLSGTLPQTIFTPAISSAVSNIANALSQYTDANFHYKGPYTLTWGNGNDILSGDFSVMRYTVTNSANLPLNSSIPVSKVDAFTQFFLPDNRTIKSYVYTGDQVWHYWCNISVSPALCDAAYTDFPLASVFGKVGGNWASAGWSANPPPNTVDNFTAFVNKATNFATMTLSQGTRFWKYTCNLNLAPITCTALATDLWEREWQRVSGWANPSPSWFAFPPPSSVDSFHHFVLPDGFTLKNYIVKNNLVWHYSCDLRTNPLVCTAHYVYNIKDVFAPIGNRVEAGWTGVGTPPFDDPNGTIDSWSALLMNDNRTMKSYVFKGGRVWHYTCDLGATPIVCTARYTMVLGELWRPIRGQHNWPHRAEGSIYQFRGVSDWGFDGVFQNGAYAIVAQLNPAQAHYYQAMQQEEINRGYQLRTPLPPRYSNNQWSWDAFDFPVLSEGGLNYLADGMQAYKGIPARVDYPFAPTIGQRIFSHLWLNVFYGRNAASAYLLHTNNRLLKQFFTDPPTPTFTPPPPLPGDFVKDNSVDFKDLQYVAANFGVMTIFDYRLMVANYGKSQ